ncbi:hypothetical protein C8Q76DRAFT_693615 [Earliella scabrosa]|nr:hypothetical protein C8Q76DRAFT_693615 [Earliella scabrosa]
MATTHACTHKAFASRPQPRLKAPQAKQTRDSRLAASQYCQDQALLPTGPDLKLWTRMSRDCVRSTRTTSKHAVYSRSNRIKHLSNILEDGSSTNGRDTSVSTDRKYRSDDASQPNGTPQSKNAITAYFRLNVASRDRPHEHREHMDNPADDFGSYRRIIYSQISTAHATHEPNRHSIDRRTLQDIAERVRFLNLGRISDAVIQTTEKPDFEPFPLIAPALVEHLKLSQPQMTTIALAGMGGQYTFAALVWTAIDRLFAREVAQTPPDVDHPSASSFYRLVLYFGMIGLATVSSYARILSYALGYFSLVFAATKTFPQSIGIASGTSMSIFGLSPLFLSLIASFKFTPPGETLDIPRFFTFMAVATGMIHLTSAFVFRVNRALERKAAHAGS